MIYLTIAVGLLLVASAFTSGTETAQTMRLVRYDARCHGASARTGGADALRWSNLAEDMTHLADALDADRVVLGGASMGCATALYAAVARWQAAGQFSRPRGRGEGAPQRLRPGGGLRA